VGEVTVENYILSFIQLRNYSIQLEDRYCSS